jgi:hypothetical protein
MAKDCIYDNSLVCTYDLPEKWVCPPECHNILPAPEPPAIIIPDGMALVPTGADTDIEVIELVKSAKIVCQWAASRVIAGPEDVKLATEDLSSLALTSKAVKEKRLEYVKPYNTLLDGINGVFKPVIEALDKATAITKQKMLAYNAEVRRKIAEAEKLNQEAIDLARRQAEANNGQFTVDTTPVKAPEPPAAKVFTDVGNTSIVKTWKYRITSFKDLDDLYKLENTVVLGQIARKIGKNQPPEIKGVEFYQEEGIRTTT